MSARKKNTVRLLYLLPVLGLGVALAAAIFDPDLTDVATLSTQPVGTVGAPVASGYILNGSQQMFVIDYDSQDWTGNLHSYDLSVDGAVSSADNWDGGARAQIEAQNAGTGASRYIVTMNGSTKIPFRWPSLSTAQKTALDSATSTTATTSPVLDYLRGSKANETPSGLGYRARTYVLGDIIHSTPRYWNDGTNRTVYVGANDGMLHAINADDGTERFAYIPSVLIPKLPNLKTIGYAHKYFVDGQLAARKFGSQSILVGGLGGGGKGLFGIDITTVPTSESDAASKILWEITNATAGYTNLGHTYGTPQLATLPDGTNAMIIGNGYNNTGNGRSSLFLINPATGTRIAEIDAGTGSASAPNGLSSPTVVDANFDGRADFAYAGDIDGNLWKFDLAARTSTLLHATSPAQAITMAPGYKLHPLGGYMITFATGRIFNATDETDTATHYAYGIWDRPGAYAANDTLLAQTLTETTYTNITPSIRVRTASDNQPRWTAGAGNHKGWRTPLPIGGERVVGDGGYVPDSVFLFMSTNPTVSPTSFPPFENWWMQLNALTGGDTAEVRFDLNADKLFTALDTVAVGANTMSPVGRHMGGGVRSQLTEFSAPDKYQIFYANYDVNGDPPIVSVATHGVDGGHFDFDIYHGAVTSTGTQASATIVVSANGQTSPFPATLGAITVDGVVVVPALTVTDLPNGTATTINATTIKNKVGGGYTATISGNTITIKAPVGAAYNGKTLAIADGSSQTLVTPVVGVDPIAGVIGAAPTPGTLVITNANKDKDLEIKCGGAFTLPRVRSAKSDFVDVRLDDLYTKINIAANGYTTSCNKVVSSSTGLTTALSCAIEAPVGPSACSSFTLKEMAASTNIGPQGGVNPVTEVIGVTAVPQSGWTNFKPALSTTAFTGGADGTVAGMTCTSCGKIDHFHEYDDTYDRTGVNMLDPSYRSLLLSNAIRSLSTPFKILAQNQYLNPATEVHINGTPSYQYNVHAGYTPIKNFVTYTDIASPAAVVAPAVVMLDDAKLPTYTRATLRSFAVNMPINAFSINDWWGGANIGNPPTPAPPDFRVGLHPTRTGCVNGSAGTSDGNMFEPVIPPGMGDAWGSPALTVPAHGLLGYGTKPWVVAPATVTTPATARGARHNGALTLQVIKAETPYSAVEMTIPNHPEYGWRVKAANFGTYVLAEYTVFWHHPSIECFGLVGWFKDPPPDTSAPSASSSTNLAAAALASDPKIGALGSGGSGVTPGSTTTTVTNANGTTTTTTVTITVNIDGTVTTTTTVTNSGGGSTTTSQTTTMLTGGAVDSRGIIGGGVTSPKDALGRINWRELLR